MKELFEAVRAADLSRVAELVKANPSLEIFAACILGETDKVEQLTAGNRSLATALSDDGWTPLHLAAFFGHDATARALMNKGASVSARSTNAMNNMPIHAAAAGRHTEMVRFLIERGANVNAQQHGGWTALHAAAQTGNLDMAKVLVDAGAHVEIRADNQQRPLDLALTGGHQPVVEYLEANGAKL
jgi:ankyrin repeat protein